MSTSGFTHNCRFMMVVGFMLAAGTLSGAFVNFETPPVHPIALSGDGRILAVCSLPAHRLELFDVTSGIPASMGNVPVGLDPVSVRFRTTSEVWVVNHISSSISIVDLAKRSVVATLDTLPGPADVIFAGTPTRAFVSCAKANAVQVCDPLTRSVLTNLVIEGERPKALAGSLDGSKVYVAIFESGNASTILAPALTQVDNAPSPGAVGHADGPYGGRNPPPNSGSTFSPPLNSAIPSNQPPPLVSHIVKKDAAGRWLDDNNGDWTEFISGTNSHLSGRIQGWDMPDHDLAMIDTATFAVTYANGLMNISMDVAVNPASGRIAVIGTDATNERRFEPNLRGTFVRVKLAMIDFDTGQKAIKDLNPHLNYQTSTLPESERDKSIGDPRAILWNSSGTRGYVSGMGSRNLLVLDADGNRTRSLPLELGEGPAGLALDEARQQLYAFNRFSATISVLDVASETVVTNVPFFDPTPEVIKRGRKHLYDTRGNSGLGQVSCGSCHVDGRMDRLAWDLGDPSGALLRRSDLLSISFEPDSPTFSGATFHPMKGPMVTQTFQDMIGHEPFHWRGDRAGLEEFNQTFVALLGRDTLLTTGEIQEFKDFLATIHFPPNLARNFDDTLSTNVALSDPFDEGVFAPPPLPVSGYPTAIGDAVRGHELFVQLRVFGGAESTCFSCHNLPTGLGSRIAALVATNGDFHPGLIRLGRSDLLPFKGPQLRNLADKTGLFFSRTNSRAGFGLMHDGRADTLARFLRDGFGLEEVPQDILDFMAFSLSLSVADQGDALLGPVFFRHLEVATSVGKQLTVTKSDRASLFEQMLSVAGSPSNQVDLVVHGTQDGLRRGWVYDRFSDLFQSDRNGQVISTPSLLTLAAPGNALTFTAVPRGSGQRIGIDADEDGYFDRTEVEFGSDPDNPNSTPARVLSISQTDEGVTLTWQAAPGRTYRLQFKNSLADPEWSNLSGDITADSTVASKTDSTISGSQERYYRVQLVE